MQSNGATVSGTVTIDGLVTFGPDVIGSSEIGSFEYELTGGSYNNQVVATATSTIYGWLAQRDSTSVPNGTYILTPVATVTTFNGTFTGTGIDITVSNLAPTAQVLIPKLGATLVGPTILDGTAAYPQNVTQFTFDLHGTPIGTATLTIYGFILRWTTFNPSNDNGTHTIRWWRVWACPDHLDG